MRSIRGRRRIVAVVSCAAVSCALAACSSGDDSVSDAAAVPTSPPTSSREPVAAPTATEPEVLVDGPMAEVCPASVVIQTTGRPSVQLGALHLLTGADAAIGDGVVAGPLTRADGIVEDVRLEIRSGGPSTGFRDALDVAASDGSVTIIHTSLSAMLRRDDMFPTIGVATLTELSREGIVFDPATAPGVETLDDLAAEGIEVRHFTDSAPYIYLTDTGALTADQRVDGFDGGLAAFVAGGGSFAQQGDLLLDPLLFQSLPQWAKPVGTIALSDAGWADHDDVLAVRADALVDLTPCLTRLIPVVQRALVAYVDDPGPTNETMASATVAFDPLSRITAQILDDGVGVAVDTGVIGNGANSTIGDFDLERLNDFVPTLAESLGIEAVPLDQLVTDQFVDPTTGR